MFPEVNEMIKKIDPDMVYLVFVDGEIEINCECHGASYYSIQDFLGNHGKNKLKEILED